MCEESGEKFLEVHKVHYFALDDLAILEVPKVSYLKYESIFEIKYFRPMPQ